MFSVEHLTLRALRSGVIRFSGPADSRQHDADDQHNKREHLALNLLNLDDEARAALVDGLRQKHGDWLIDDLRVRAQRIKAAAEAAA